jgi:hypothetical protein
MLLIFRDRISSALTAGPSSSSHFEYSGKKTVKQTWNFNKTIRNLSQTVGKAKMPLNVKQKSFICCFEPVLKSSSAY